MRPFIFQMGKVGSSSIADATCGRQVHTINPRIWLATARKGITHTHRAGLLMWVVRPKKIITAVREPVGRNLSAFMYNSRRENWGKSLSEFLEHYPHDRPLTWFDDEMKYFTGIDVFDYPFPHDRGWQVVEDRILIIKAESDDDTKEEALGHFLGEKIVLPRSNVGSQSYYAADYANLKSQPIPEHYLDYMYNSRYARHFYSDEEIARFRTHWTQG